MKSERRQRQRAGAGANRSKGLGSLDEGMRDMRRVAYRELEAAERHLLREARRAARHAYNPYSRFAVGAALRAVDGRVFSAANFETAAGTSICAERAAVVTANAAGCREFTAVAIVAGSRIRPALLPTAPCGTCRQVLHELASIAGRELVVLMASTDFMHVVRTTVSALLPMPFGPADVGVDVTTFRTRRSSP